MSGLVESNGVERLAQDAFDAFYNGFYEFHNEDGRREKRYFAVPDGGESF